MNKYQCQVCGAVSYSAASQENLKDDSCLECDGRVEMVEGDKMNADEIVRALETEVLCENFPHNESNCPDDGCYYIMAAALIDKLQALAENGQSAIDTNMRLVKVVESLQAQLAERDKELKRLQREVAALAIESIEREKTLAKLEAEVMVWAKAEQEGRLVVLPCKVGTSVFDISDGTAYETRVLNFVVGRDGVSCKTVSSWPDVSEFGTRIFLTREEAEAALKGGEKDG